MRKGSHHKLEAIVKLREARRKQGSPFTGRHHKQETIIKLREQRLGISMNAGEANGMWRGGVSRNKNGNHQSRQWRKKIYERDNYTCQDCGAKSGNGKEVILNADHIKPWALFPELRFDLNNGRTLCIDCHKKTDTYAGKLFTYSRDLLYNGNSRDRFTLLLSEVQDLQI